MLGINGWAIMMLMLMPMMGQGLFSMNIGVGIMAPIMTFILHVIFGAVLGFAYEKLPPQVSRTA